MNETKQAQTSAETRAALHEVLAAFEGFKAANDEKLAAIEARRPDVVLEEKVARIDAAMASASARVERLAAEVRRPGLDARSLLPPSGCSRSGAGGEIFAPETKRFSDYLRLGVETKGLAASGDGGVVVSPETERFIERRLAQASPMRSLAQVRTVGAGVFRKPVSITGVEAGWVAETAARPETDPATLALLEFPAADLYASPAATQSLLEDAYVNLDEWLAAEVEDAFAAQETNAFINGTGVNRPKGLLAYDKVADGIHVWGKLGYVATGAAGALPAAAPVDPLIDLIYAPKSQYRPGASFLMNRRTAGAIRKVKDADGNYVWSPATQPGRLPSLLGYPVAEIESMPDMADGAFAVAFGDFAKGYLVVDRAGVRVLRDPYSAKPYVLFYTTKRVGGGVQNFDAVKLLRFAAA